MPQLVRLELGQHLPAPSSVSKSLLNTCIAVFALYSLYSYNGCNAWQSVVPQCDANVMSGAICNYNCLCTLSLSYIASCPLQRGADGAGSSETKSNEFFVVCNALAKRIALKALGCLPKAWSFTLVYKRNKVTTEN